MKKHFLTRKTDEVSSTDCTVADCLSNCKYGHKSHFACYLSCLRVCGWIL